MGQLAAEYATGTIAASPCTICYVAADHLGSTRALWDTSGLKARYDYHPFGEAIAADRNGRTGMQCAAGVATCYNGPSSVAQRFTGQLRDEETGLDYFNARYMTSGQGRFMSADRPFADQQEEDPQSWNLYTYVGNNPLLYVDIDGEAKAKAAAAVVQRLQVGFRHVMVRHEGRSLTLKQAKDRVLQQGGDVITNGEATAQRLAGGRNSVQHDAHTQSALDALPHYHPTTSSGKKKRAHAFVRGQNRILIPGAAIGVSLFGDNLFGQAIDFFNPLGDVQEFTDLMDFSIIPSIFGFADRYLMGPTRTVPEGSSEISHGRAAGSIPHVISTICYESEARTCP